MNSWLAVIFQQLIVQLQCQIKLPPATKTAHQDVICENIRGIASSPHPVKQLISIINSVYPAKSLNHSIICKNIRLPFRFENIHHLDCLLDIFDIEKRLDKLSAEDKIRLVASADHPLEEIHGVTQIPSFVRLLDQFE